MFAHKHNLIYTHTARRQDVFISWSATTGGGTWTPARAPEWRLRALQHTAAPTGRWIGFACIARVCCMLRNARWRISCVCMSERVYILVLAHPHKHRHSHENTCSCIFTQWTRMLGVVARLYIGFCGHRKDYRCRRLFSFAECNIVHTFSVARFPLPILAIHPCALANLCLDANIYVCIAGNVNGKRLATLTHTHARTAPILLLMCLKVADVAANVRRLVRELLPHIGYQQEL